MRKRNIILEGRIKSWLPTVDLKKCNKKQQGLLLLAVEKLYKATEDIDYHAWAEAAVNQLVDENGAVDGLEGSLSDYFFGDALFAVADSGVADEERITAAIKNLAAKLAGQERSHATATCDGIFSEKLGDTYSTQVFYMNYETKFGGKEHYNDVIAQFNILRETVYEQAVKALGENSANLEMAAYASAAVDTMEVMEQPLYEIYDRLKRLFKEAVGAMNEASVKGFLEEESSAALLYAYAVLKGCRMKALHTEKYEKTALEILTKAETKAQECTECDAALVMAYAESLRNRDYQDYGRAKGGVLWS